MNTKAFLLLLLASAVQAENSLRGWGLAESADLEPNQGQGPCTRQQAFDLCPSSKGCQDRATKYAIARGNGYRCINYRAVCSQIAQGKECYVLPAPTEPDDAQEPAFRDRAPPTEPDDAQERDFRDRAPATEPADAEEPAE